MESEEIQNFKFSILVRFFQPDFKVVASPYLSSKYKYDENIFGLEVWNYSTTMTLSFDQPKVVMCVPEARKWNKGGVNGGARHGLFIQS